MQNEAVTVGFVNTVSRVEARPLHAYDGGERLCRGKRLWPCSAKTMQMISKMACMNLTRVPKVLFVSKKSTNDS